VSRYRETTLSPRSSSQLTEASETASIEDRIAFNVVLGIDHKAYVIGYMWMKRESAEICFGHRLCTLLAMLLSLCCCDRSAVNDSDEYPPCFSIKEAGDLKSLYILELVESENANRRPSCSDLFETLAPEVPKVVRRITIVALELNVADLRVERENCGYEDLAGDSYWRREISEMMIKCPNFYVANVLRSKTGDKMLAGNFIPSDYRNQDRAVDYWTRPSSVPSSMLAGAYESIEFGIIPVCLLFREAPSGTLLSRLPHNLQSPETIDAIEGCVKRFVMLN